MEEGYGEMDTCLLLYRFVISKYAAFFLAYGVQMIDLWKKVENDRIFLKFPLFYRNIKILCHGLKKTILKTASNLVISLFSHMDLKNNFEH